MSNGLFIAGTYPAKRQITEENYHEGDRGNGPGCGNGRDGAGGAAGELKYDPVPSNDGDAFGLDFAIRDERTGLFGIGIECDAPRHELLRCARAREIWRPAVLARAIPVVH